MRTLDGPEQEHLKQTITTPQAKGAEEPTGHFRIWNAPSQLSGKLSDEGHSVIALTNACVPEFRVPRSQVRNGRVHRSAPGRLFSARSDGYRAQADDDET